MATFFLYPHYFDITKKCITFTVKKKMVLWLDDIRDPEIFSNKYGLETDEIIWVKNYYDFIDWINLNGLPRLIAFDHDLGDVSENEKTGFSAAKWLVEYCLDNRLKLPEWVILSANTVGAENIKCLLKNFKKHSNE